ncbi:MAG: phosphatidate cytidylyltransferase [Phycisphaerales bacterium]
MLKYRLIFGTLMTIFFVGLILLDGHIDGSLSSRKINSPVQGTILLAFLVIVAIPANFELSKLIGSSGVKIFLPITIASSILLAGGWYLSQFTEIFGDSEHFASMFFILVFGLSTLAIFLWQGLKYAAIGAFSNIGGNLLAICYLGALTSFIMKLRIDFGPLAFLMFIFVVKFCDIGAYTCGRMFGKHKFSPIISPKKTWEGMAGGVLFSVIASFIFVKAFDIMPVLPAIIFGAVFAFIGQLGDLAESLLKRAAETKDSASIVPGFGGVLDVIDSPLAAGVFAYLYFLFVVR